MVIPDRIDIEEEARLYEELCAVRRCIFLCNHLINIYKRVLPIVQVTMASLMNIRTEALPLLRKGCRRSSQMISGWVTTQGQVPHSPEMFRYTVGPMLVIN